MESRARTNVFIVEDSASVRACLVDLLDDIEGVSVVGEAESPAQAVQGIFDTRPDCVVLDFQLLGGTGVEVLRAVHPKAPEVIFIVLTNHPNPQYRRICMQAGASWFLDKSTEFGKIKEVIAGFEPARQGPKPTNGH